MRGAEKEEGKCSQLEDGKVELLPAPLPFPISQGSIGVSTTSDGAGEAGERRESRATCKS